MDVGTPRRRGARALIHPTHIYDVLDLCALAGDRLRRAGFVVAHVSMRSEAVYFRHPPLDKLLRVSAHKQKHGPIGMDGVVAKLTFSPGRRSADRRHLIRTESAIDQMIWTAIGQYFDREPAPSEYQGKRGTWEHAAAGGPSDV